MIASLSFFAGVALALRPVPAAILPLIHKPAEWQPTGKSWQVPEKVTITSGPAERKTALVLASVIGKARHIGDGEGDIRLRLRPRATELPSKEAYRLSITSSGIDVEAVHPAGLHNGAMSAAQLVLHARMFNRSTGVASGTITDQPKFAWRGMHLDVSRHFFSVSEVKDYLDYLSFYKFNTFHWHLIDDGGWRLEIGKYPKLTEVGAFRQRIPSWNQGQLQFPPPGSKVERYGGFYTQKEIREVVEYAARRNITVVPEIELPGHTMPSIAAYPNLACRDYSAAGFRQASGNLSANVYCAGKEETFRFLEDVLQEVVQLFPSRTIHVGGDEVNKYLWMNCPDCQARMKSEGLKDVDELQSYFIRRIEKLLASRGRRLMGWDEILEGGLAPNAQVMSWRGIAGGLEAANAGHDVVMSPTDPCYFDYTYQDNSVEKVYAFNPIPSSLPADKHHHILGGQANVWTEWMPRFSRVQEMIFPRMIAMSEALWTPIEQRDLANFRPRLARHFAMVDQWGVEQMLPSPQPNVSVVFAGESQSAVSFAPSPYHGLVLRRGENGQIPHADSPSVSAPVNLRPGEALTVAFVNSRGKRGAIRTVECVEPEVHSGPLFPGLRMEVYSGTWRRVPQFAQLTRASSHFVGSVSPGHMKGKDNYALRFTGVLKVPTAGKYTFYLGSDDGSWLRLGGAKLVDNDDLHGFIWAEGSVELQPKGYPIEVGFFEQGGNDDLRLEVSGPGVSRRPVPSEWLHRGF